MFNKLIFFILQIENIFPIILYYKRVYIYINKTKIGINPHNIELEL